MERLMLFFGLTMQDAVEITSFISTIIMFSAFFGHFFAEVFFRFLEFLLESLDLLFRLIVKRMGKKPRK